ncbi:ATP-binding protein [Streptomyces sp. W1SF4]|uniref:sensor histidine kinase n=2 Tax=unclassified Streptomyces TaxID=2593676 RepID=UPI000F6E90FE|nr:ATP-binding protein [Streptomyces sp. W1SF4]AZM92132.1 ATP-binding protein [Streptomyces sp. W1SF4]
MSGLRAARHSPSRHAVKGPGRQIRPQLIRAAVLPTLAAGLSGAAAVMFTLHLGGGSGARDDRLWPVLAGCALLAVGALAAALLGAQRAAKAVRDRCEALRRSSVRGREELRTAAERLARGEGPVRPVRGDRAGAPPEGEQAGVDEFWLLAQELRGAREQAQTTLVRLALPAAPTDSDRKVEVFVNLARRLQSLVHREISLLDGLEDTVEDPDLLKELFHVDHLATRIRRHAENLAVLGGAASRRQWTRPIDLSEVLRSSVAEVEQYTRVKVVPPAGGTVRGHAVADVVHLLAELVENATVFSAPDTDVVVRAERVTAGIAVEVEDRGLGMPAEEQHRMNTLLADPDQVSVRHLLADGRIGLFVVSALARRHGIAVELKSNIYGGVLAVLVLPQGLLGAEAPGAADAAGGSRATSWGTVSWPDTLRPVPRDPLPPTARPTRPAPPPAAEPGPARTPLPYAAEGRRPGGPDGLAPAPAADPDPAALPYAAEGRRAGDADGPTPAPAAHPDPEPAQVPVPYAAEGRRAGGDVPDAAYVVDPAGGAARGFWQAPERGPVATPAREAAPAVEAAPAGGAVPEPAGGLDGVLAPALPPAPAPGSEPTAWGAEPGPGAGGAGLGPVVAAPGPGGSVWAWGPAAEEAPDPDPAWPLDPGTGAAAGLEPAWPRHPGPGTPEPGARPGPARAWAAQPPPHRVPPQSPAPEAARPPLPRRRAQQHLVPQLREAPAPRRTDETEQPLHDPGLMAAFQRGFGLAQTDEQA